MPRHGKLTPQEKFAAHLLAQGHSVKQVLTMTDFNPQAFRTVMQLPLFQQCIDHYQADLFATSKNQLIARLDNLQAPALEKMSMLLDADSESVQHNSAKWLLETGIFQPPRSAALQPALQQNIINLDAQALTAILHGALRANNGPVLQALQTTMLPPAPPPSTPEPIYEEEQQSGDLVPVLHTPLP